MSMMIPRARSGLSGMLGLKIKRRELARIIRGKDLKKKSH
jgi:hypothetical protein